MARLRALAVAAASLALVAMSSAGCGEQRAAAPEVSDSPGASHASASAPTENQAEVTAVETLPDGTGFTFVVRVPDGPDADCAGEVSARQDALENRTHYVTTTVLTSAAYADCPDVAERRVDLLVEPRGLDLAVNQELWSPGPDGTYVRCSPELGCDPPEDRCDPVWTQLLTDGTELPPEKRVDVLACADGWLVADVDAVVTGCQSVDGAAPPSGCAGSGVHVRWFARLGPDDLWQVVASGDAAGCADVRASVPEFPESLCAGLPARAAS